MNLIEWPYYREEFLKSQGFTPTIVRRFWEKVRITESCWLWTAFVNPHGYGMIGTKRPLTTIASRVSWILRFGPIPKATPCVLHNCPGGDNPRCVNPDHLWLGTRADNNRDMIKKGRAVYPKYLPGALSPNAKLSPQTVSQIRRLLESGLWPSQVGKLLGIPRSTVGNIKYGNCWVQR